MTSSDQLGDAVGQKDEQRQTIDAFDQTTSADRQKNDLYRDERRMLDWLDGCDEILELGCGEGRFTRHLTGHDVTALDAAPRRAQMAADIAPVAVGDAGRLPFPAESFDGVVFALNGIDYLYPLRRRLEVYAEVHRVLRPGGVFAFSTHNRYWVPLPWEKPWSFVDWVSDHLSAGKPWQEYQQHSKSGHDYYGYAAHPRYELQRLESEGFEIGEWIGRDHDDWRRWADPWVAIRARKSEGMTD